LPKEQGSYLNADNEPAAAARFAAFDAWSREQGLRWEGVGLDIEPNFAELSALKRRWWRLSTTLLRRTFDGSRLYRARQDYSELIGTIRSRGYPVQTYQMPFLSVEREAHSSLFDRMLGTVDVRGDQEYMMLYTSFARPVGGAMIWTLGPNAQAISIGVTDGGPGTSPAPLNWDEFSRDLILASHFSRFVGVYNLEGCVNQGFLPRLKSFDWSGTVIIPADTLRRTDRVHRALRLVLWIGTYLPYLIAVLLLAIVAIVRGRRIRNRNREFSMRADSRS